jgi:cell division protein FtsB
LCALTEKVDALVAQLATQKHTIRILRAQNDELKKKVEVLEGAKVKAVKV